MNVPHFPRWQPKNASIHAHSAWLVAARLGAYEPTVSATNYTLACLDFLYTVVLNWFFNQFERRFRISTSTEVCGCVHKAQRLVGFGFCT